jgi:hypothetical protein
MNQVSLLIATAGESSLMAVTLPRPCAFGFADRFKGRQATVATKHDIIRTGEDATGGSQPR